MKTQRLTRADIERRLTQAYDEMLEKNNLSPFAKEAKRLLAGIKTTENLGQVLIVGGMSITTRMLIENYGRALARATKIRTEDELQQVIQLIKEKGETLPTVIREATKVFKQTLPRRGGPGRRPILSAKETVQVCDHIAMFIRQKWTLKQALAKVAEISPTLLGKKVGQRTLQKAWDNRDSFPAG